MSGLVGYLNNPVRIVAGADAPGAKEWQFDNAGNIRLPQGGDILDYTGTSLLGIAIGTGNLSFDADTIRNNVQLNPIILETRDGTSTVVSWTFDSDGSLTLPFDGQLVQNQSIVRTTDANGSTVTPTVLWTSTRDDIVSAKLQIQVECDETGDLTGTHSQTVEVNLAARAGGGTPSISVYGIVYTSTLALMTFTTQRNGISNLIEIVGTASGIASGTIRVKIHSVEMITRN